MRIKNTVFVRLIFPSYSDSNVVIKSEIKMYWLKYYKYINIRYSYLHNIIYIYIY